MARAWTLIARPKGMPTPDDFAFEEIALPALGDGQVRVANRWLSVDPYMRGRMNDVKSYVPPFALGEPMEGGAIGEVVESRADGLAPGDLVFHMAGWRDEAVLPAKAAQKLTLPGVPPQAFLGVLGLTGMTAYWGLVETGQAKAGETVFVSAAAGAVGSAVVQIAKARGMTVIGSAGGEAKCAWVKELGADAVIDYKAEGSLVKKLAAAAPDGIDVYFDNVGGAHLDAAFALARRDARFAICGMIDAYNSTEPTKLLYLPRIISQRIMMRGFIYFDYHARTQEFFRDVGPLVEQGKLQSRETVHEGLENTLDAFLALFSGGNTGKMLVKL